ncbi:hypothetical protein [Natrinema salifodinae]|uniref:ArsR family transcriptional regulator n=1 Tax=Natrinema salifodinae TaxID=1202768 RepID=A0A1I0NEI4_9EURY|nr:hypothetical protein [Natrinema salifodinae]SEV99133.1 hypothetical protein SAMN05216285_1593 [Natrinema salifodinae]
MVSARRENGTRVIRRWNDVFRAISAEPRRQLLLSLLDSSPDESVPLPESAVNPNAPAAPETLRRALFHNHLPTLAELEFIDWDRDPLVATRGPRFDEVAVVFDALHSHATEIPDPLVIGCQRLEREREFGHGE